MFHVEEGHFARTMSGSRVVIVEQDIAYRNVLANLFAGRGWQVVSARSTAEALMCLEPAPDCVILDLMQPGKGGELLLWKIRSEKLSIRVVVTTAGCDAERARVVFGLRPDAFFEKPVDPESLYRACESGPNFLDTGGAGRSSGDSWEP